MTSKKNKTKCDLVNLVYGSAEQNSSSKETARAYLQSEEINVDKLVADGLKRIKLMQMLANAKRTEEEQLAADAVKEKATAWVDSLLDSMDFSLPKLVQQENLSMSFRNMENLSKEDIRNILIKHFTLKFMNGDKDSK